MGLSNELLESLNEGARTDDRALMRIISSAKTNEDRTRLISEAYNDGKIAIDFYVAAMGMQRARVLPGEPTVFLAALHESIDKVPSRTVAAVESYWVEKAKAHGSMDSLFEALFKKSKGKKEEPDEEEDGDESDDEEDAEESEEGE